MTRTVARQIAVRICFSADFLKEDPDTLLNDFFAPDHYSSLSDSDPVYNEIPDDIQMEYIHKLLRSIYLHAEEIDDRIASFSEKRKLERIPKQLWPCSGVRFVSCFILKIYRPD